MTPTRALVGLAAVAAAGYAVIHSLGGQGPQYIGDFPSIQAQSQAGPPPVTHDPGTPPVPDPPHYAAQPVTPEAPPAAAGGPGGPGPVPPAAPPGGGGTGGQGGYQPPGVGSPLSGGLTPLTDLLSGLTGTLPTLDPQGFCRLTTGQVVALPCDQIPALPTVPTEVPIGP
jgi:hypothetical protein